MEKSPFLIQLVSFVRLTVHRLIVLIVPHAPAIYLALTKSLHKRVWIFNEVLTFCKIIFS